MSRIVRKTLRTLALGAAAVLSVAALPQHALAVQLDYTCRDAADIISFGSESLQFSVVGETVGAAGMLANLACFVGDRRCGCLRNTTNSDRGESTSFSREVGRIVAACRGSNPNRNLSGISQEAALNVCG